MKIVYFIILSMLVFTSCITQNRIDRKCQKARVNYEIAVAKWGCPVNSDSTIVQTKEIIKDTTIFVPVPGQMVHDSIPVIITNGLINSQVSTLETIYSKSKAWVVDGLLKHTLDQKPSDIPVTLAGAIHNSTSSIVQTIKVPYYIDRPIPKPLTWWQKLFFWSGIIVWWVVIGYIAIKISKFSVI